MIEFFVIATLLSTCTQCQDIGEHLGLDAAVEALGFEPFELVRAWNSALLLNATDGAGSASISNAWVKITGVADCVTMNNTDYCSEKGTVFTDYGYSFSLPPLYDNGKQSVCATRSGECRTEYAHAGDRSTLAVLLNGAVLGSARAQNYSGASENVKITSQLDVVHELLVTHYTWQSGTCCQEKCSKGRCRCIQKLSECKLERTEVQTDALRVADRTDAMIPAERAELLSLRQNGNEISAEVKANNVLRYTLDIGGANVTVRKFGLRANLSSFPFLHIDAVPGTTSTTTRSFADVQQGQERDIVRLRSSSLAGCTFSFTTISGTTSQPCFVSRLNGTNLSISSPEWRYTPGSAIPVTITLQSDGKKLDGMVTLLYANASRNISVSGGSAIFEFTAETAAETILAYYAGDHTHAPADAALTLDIYEPRWIAMAFRSVWVVVLVVGLCAWRWRR